MRLNSRSVVGQVLVLLFVCACACFVRERGASGTSHCDNEVLLTAFIVLLFKTVKHATIIGICVSDLL